jgi:hypothetical protein
MEAKYWFYIIVGGICLLSRILKKNEDKENTAPRPPSTPAEPPSDNRKPQRTLTFEELLKEITEGKAATSEPNARPSFSPVIDYDDDLKEEAEDLEEQLPKYHTTSGSVRAYEEGKKAAFNRPSLEETMKVQSTDMTFGKFKVFEQEKQRNLLEEYTRQLHDPEGLKKALVMSEILNRKF